MAFLATEEIQQSAEARGMGLALVVTALGTEFRAVMAHLKQVASARGRHGIIYDCGEFNGDERDWQIVVAQSGPGNQAAQAVTLTAHHDFDRFDVMIFVGVAGSRKSDVPIGSVIASNRVYSPYAGKFEPQNTSSRPRGFESPMELVQLAMKVERDEKWQVRIKSAKGGLEIGADKYPQPYPPAAFVAPIVSVEAVMADPNSELENHIAKNYGDAHGVEMEGFGTAFAAHVVSTPAIVIRGISDMTAQKTAKTDAFLQPVAVAHASAFAFELLNLLEPARWSSGARLPRPSPAKPSTVDDPGKALLMLESETSQELRMISPHSKPHAPASLIAPPQAAAVEAPRRHNFVLNLAGSIVDYPPERREALLNALRKATGDNTVEIVRIEEGSVLFFVSAQTANLDTLASPQVGAAVKAAGAELLGVAEEESFHKLRAAKAALMHASHDLLAWPQTLPGGERLERPEFNQILQEFAEFDKSATVVLGPPGSGKSALLARIAQKMAARGWPVLGVKADVLDPSISDETGLQRQLMLDEPPSRLLAQLAEFGPVVLIIDQLDALAGFVDLKTGRLNVLMNLLRRFGQRRNMHVIVSARSFEFKHDVRLRSIEADSLDLELPPWREVLPVLAARNLHPEGWPPDVRETLRTPQHLATFLRLVDSGAAEPSQNYQAMLERLWNERVLQATGGERLARLATDIAETMAKEESLWLACSRYDDHAKDLQELERLEILTPSADRLTIGFSHQTLYDYVLARSFARGKGRLSAYVAGREASLFLRPKLWVALTYLRSVEINTYEHEISTLWFSEGLRPHLKLLLIDFMGQQKNPIEVERRLMKSVLESGAEQASAFRAITGSSGWFAAVVGSGVAKAMAESERTAWLVTAVLQQAWAFAPERVLSLIRQQWAPDSKFDAHIWTVIAEFPEWSDEIEKLAATILNRTQIPRHHIEYVMAHLGVTQSEVALRLVRVILDRELTAAIQLSTERAEARERAPVVDLTDTLLDMDDTILDMEKSPSKPFENLIEQTGNWDVLTSIAETAPDPFMRVLWPWFTNVLQALARLESQVGKWTYALMWKLDFHFDGESGSSLSPPPILRALQIATEGMATNPELLRTWVAENTNLEAAPAQRLLAHALAQSGETYAQDAFSFLMADNRRFHLGSIADESGTTKALIRAASPYWSRELRNAFVRRIRAYRLPDVPNTNLERKRSLARLSRKVRLGLIKALPHESLDPDVKIHVQQESRIFPDERIGVRKLGARFIGSPMSTEAMLKASDEDILNAFQKIPDWTDWDHPRRFLQGGNIQLSRDFADFAKHQPERAIGIIARLSPEIGSRAAGLALHAMSETAAPDLVVATFLDVARRGFTSEEFRGSAAHAIERLVDRKVTITEEIVTILQGWLGDASEPEANAPDDDDARERRKINGDQSAHAILWDSHYFASLPPGNFPILETLTRILIERGENDRIVDVWEAHLARRENPKVWRSLLRLLPSVHPTDEAARGRLIGEIFRRYPQVTESMEAVYLLGYAQWWARKQVHEVLDSWRKQSDPWLQQVLGEVSTLIALVQPELSWAVDLLNEGLASEASAERKVGVAFSAANLWNEAKCRTRASAVLLRLIPQADSKLWSAILDIFRVVKDMGDAPEVAVLLDSMVAHIHKAGSQKNTFLVDRLQGILPEHASAVGHLAKGIITNMKDELGDIRAGAAVDAPELVDIALTLHRLGGPMRELGIQLFEDLLRFDAYSARSTLEEIDARFRTGPVPTLRRRLPRRHTETKRKRLAES